MAKKGFDGQGAATGAASGAATGTMIMPGWGTAIGAVAGGLLGGFGGMLGGGSEEYDPLTSEQHEAMDALLSIGQGAGWSNIEGLYDIDKLERGGQGLVWQMIAQNPEMIAAAQKEYEGILANEYDPYNEQGSFAAYKKNALAELAKATDDMNAAMGASGNFFSTNRNRALSDLNSNTQNNLLMQMAAMYENNANRKFDAAGALSNLEGLKQNWDLNRTNAAMTYGALDRNVAQQQFNNETAKQNARIQALAAMMGVQAAPISVEQAAPDYLGAIGSGLQLGSQLKSINTGSKPSAASNPGLKTGTASSFKYSSPFSAGAYEGSSLYY
jgi:hypothetical protein